MKNKEQFQITIEPGKAERHYWIDIWRYRELFYILAWRDIAVRYKQTIIGVLWAIIRPLLTMMIFVVVFGKIAEFSSEGATAFNSTELTMSVSSILLLYLVGVLHFRKTEKTFSDVI